VPGDVIIETLIESSVAVPTEKVMEFHVVWKVVILYEIHCGMVEVCAVVSAPYTVSQKARILTYVIRLR